jgi:hypothetical protein
VRLVEWMELLSVMGADKIFLYNLEVRIRCLIGIAGFLMLSKG